MAYEVVIKCSVFLHEENNVFDLGQTVCRSRRDPECKEKCIQKREHYRDRSPGFVDAET